MAFEELRERLKDDFAQTWSRFQDSAIYTRLQERYDQLSPRNQKVVVFAALTGIFVALLSVPFSYFQSSQSYVTEFNDRRQLIKDLHEASLISAASPLPTNLVRLSAVRSMVDTEIENRRLLEEQVHQIRQLPARDFAGGLIPADLNEGGFEVALRKLNVRQIVELGTRLQALGANVKMTDLTIEPNREDERYFNVTFQLVTLVTPLSEREVQE